MTMLGWRRTARRRSTGRGSNSGEAVGARSKIERATDVEDKAFDAALVAVRNKIDIRLYDPIPPGCAGHGTRVVVRVSMVDAAGKEYGHEYEMVRGSGETIGQCVDRVVAWSKAERLSANKWTSAPRPITPQAFIDRLPVDEMREVGGRTVEIKRCRTGSEVGERVGETSADTMVRIK